MDSYIETDVSVGPPWAAKGPLTFALGCFGGPLGDPFWAPGPVLTFLGVSVVFVFFLSFFLPLFLLFLGGPGGSKSLFYYSKTDVFVWATGHHFEPFWPRRGAFLGPQGGVQLINFSARNRPLGRPT